MLARGLVPTLLASFLAATALPTLARAQDENPTTPGAIPNPGTYQGSMELQRRSDEQDQQFRQQQQQEQQPSQTYPQQRPYSGGSGAAGPVHHPRQPRVMPNFDADMRAIAAGGRHDYATALKILRPLAEHDDMFAQYLLAILYEMGRGVPQSYPTALQWYSRSVAEGYSQAMSNLGSMYERGLTGKVDYVQAYRWYALAIPRFFPGEQGSEDAVQGLKNVSSHMTAAQIAQAKRLARATNVPLLR